MKHRVRGEIERLHAFFVDWFAGRCPDVDETFAAGFTDHLAASFHYIMPDGSRAEGHALAAGLRAAHGSNPGFRIAITDVRVHVERADLVIATYIEWQAGARSFDRSKSGRLSTAVFTEAAGELRWVHVHETWLPAERLGHSPLAPSTQ